MSVLQFLMSNEAHQILPFPFEEEDCCALLSIMLSNQSLTKCVVVHNEFSQESLAPGGP